MSSQMELLKKYGLSVRGHLGQHLLTDPNLQKKIVGLLEISADEEVLEIGPGLGALTRLLLDEGCKVIAVEKDRVFAEILKNELSLGAKGTFKIVHADILKCDLKKLVAANGFKHPKIKVISNLPYYITAPILFDLIGARAMISRAVLTMQKEVAARLVALPGVKDYGRLSLAVRYVADARKVFDISRYCFIPQPKVDSSVVVLDFYPPSKSGKKIDEEILFRLIQSAFSQRRKTLLHNLLEDKKIKASRLQLVEWFRQWGWPETVRGEELLLKDYLALAEKVLPFFGAK